LCALVDNKMIDIIDARL